MGAWSWIDRFRRGGQRHGGGAARHKEAVDRLAHGLTVEALRREGWLDAGIWAPSVAAAEARSAILRHVAVTGDE